MLAEERGISARDHSGAESDTAVVARSFRWSLTGAVALC
jgi:hypothetical protein